ncbi:MAG: DUF1772 domain-containing protein [Candidatus Rokuibacteriota bacterium]
MATWSFVTLVLAALALAAPLAHALEMPVRRTYDPALYVMVTHTLYRYFGTVGAAFEVGAIACALIWCGLLRRAPGPRAAIRWAVAGAACLVLAHVLFWLLINPVNQQFAIWTPEAVPADWMRLRDQWEFTHTGRAGLFLLGFCAILASTFLARSGAGRGKNTG